MELEEMRTLWQEMSAEIEKQKKLTDSLIIKMTQSDHRKKLDAILIPEIAGSLVCLASALYILINLQKLNTWYLLVCGIACLLVLFLLPALSIKAVYKMRSVNISANNYKQSLQQYSKGRMQFVFAQKLSFYLGAILLVAVLPVMSMLIGSKDPFMTNRLWMCYVIMFPFFYLFSRWVFKKYIKTIRDAENILKELEG